MRRIEKEYLKKFKMLDVEELLIEVREMPVTSILEQREQAKAQAFYRDGGRKVQVLINAFYFMALNHAQGIEKALSHNA